MTYTTTHRKVEIRYTCNETGTWGYSFRHGPYLCVVAGLKTEAEMLEDAYREIDEILEEEK